MAQEHESLLAYDPARGAPDEATAAAAARLADDAELKAWHEAELAFDAAFAAKLAEAPVPADLPAKILAAAKAAEAPTPAPVISGETQQKSFWLHGGFLAMAAAVMAFLALAYTFVINPAERQANAQTLALMEQIDLLSQQIQPEHFAEGFQPLAQFVSARGGPVPSFLPAKLENAQGYACQILEIDGHPVGVICFKDGEQTYHLFTISRDAVPEQVHLFEPTVQHFDGRDCASWTCEKNLYILTGDGEMDPGLIRL